MPKKQTTAGKKARAAARQGEKYTTALRRQLPYVSGPDAADPMCLEHRRLLDHALGFRPFRGTDLFERIGGQPTIDRLVDLLYEGIGDDDQLRPLFPRDLAGGRPGQKLFFAEWLGISLARMLTADPGLAQATDPAVDVLDITPVEHAVAGGHASALRLIVDHVAHPLPGCVRALRGAAAQGSLAMVELLLAHGADATRIGVGRRILHPELAPLSRAAVRNLIAPGQRR